MGSKIKSILLSGTLLVSSAMYAEQAQEKAEEKEVKIEHVQNASEQRAELEEKLKQAEDNLPNAFERGMGKVTSFFRIGAGYLADGVSYPIRGVGKMFGYGGEKVAQGVAAVGGVAGLPSTGNFVGSLLRFPTDLVDTGLNVAGNSVDSAVNNVTDVLMTGFDSAAIATRNPSEAGRTALGGLVKNTAYGFGDVVENVGELATLGNKNVNIIPKAIGSAAHVGGDIADIAIREGQNTQDKRQGKNHWDELSHGRTVEKLGSRVNQFKHDMSDATQLMMSSQEAKTFFDKTKMNDDAKAKEAMIGFMKAPTTQKAASRIFGIINSALDDAKILSAELNAESKEIGLKERLRNGEKAKQDLEAFNEAHPELETKAGSGLKDTLEAAQETVQKNSQNTAIPTQTIISNLQKSK